MYYVPTLQPRRSQEPVGVDKASGQSTDAPVLLRDRRLIGRNQVFSVYFDRLEQSDGHQVADYLSVVPKVRCQDGISGVAVLPELDGKFGLVHVYRHPLGVAAWEIPRGFVDPSESAVDAAVRELREEMGMEATAPNLVDLGVVAPESGMIAARIQIYWARRCIPTGFNGAKELGHGAIRFFSPEEVDGLIARNEIEDPCTLIAYFRRSRAGYNSTCGK